LTMASTRASDPLAALVGLRELPVRLVIGLLSGTSADGTDAALCEIRGAGETTALDLLAFLTTPFPRLLRERLYALAEADASELCEVDVLLGESFAEAARDVCSAARVALRDVHLIGSHGQTAAHRPRSAGRLGATLQIGEAAVIAERTGVPVVSDFRVRDVAAGGEGAPLVPLADYLLYRKAGVRRALQNIGGIANVTLVAEARDDTLAFDNGPGNMALDAVARAASGQVGEGRFAFTVRSTGGTDAVLYLDSEPNYRDSANLAVDVPQALLAGLGQKLGGDVKTAMVGRQVTVTGVPRRVLIRVRNTDGTEGRYFQTHIRLDSLDQIVIGP